mmetsp:Transcript_13195/g.55239  ORF Transcript_13195/g.55239 Transcript_13195/m.55239 type:complete len:257 (+) Transcript_13195:3381-4151(+)
MPLRWVGANHSTRARWPRHAQLQQCISTRAPTRSLRRYGRRCCAWWLARARRRLLPRRARAAAPQRHKLSALLAIARVMQHCGKLWLRLLPMHRTMPWRTHVRSPSWWPLPTRALRWRQRCSCSCSRRGPMCNCSARRTRCFARIPCRPQPCVCPRMRTLTRMKTRTSWMRPRLAWKAAVLSRQPLRVCSRGWRPRSRPIATGYSPLAHRRHCDLGTFWRGRCCCSEQRCVCLRVLSAWRSSRTCATQSSHQRCSP